MTVIIDYDAGNTHSVINALRALGEDPVLSADREVIRDAKRLILPGVGAFGDAMKRLRERKLDQAIKEAVSRGIPLLGICLGQQLLLSSSEESPGAAGLGIIPGVCRRIPASQGVKVPQIGWNSLSFPMKGKLFGEAYRREKEEGIRSYVYFVHSYYTDVEDRSVVCAETFHGIAIPAALEKGNVFACQFHPEKSGDTGLAILSAFLGQE